MGAVTTPPTPEPPTSVPTDLIGTRPYQWSSWRVAALIAALIAVFGGYTIYYAATGPRPSTASAPAAPAKTALRVAYETCGSVGELADADLALYLDMEGGDANSGTLTVTNIACVLAKLDAPSYVIHKMDSTRALDGRQSESWGDFEASWSYHPDEGLDVLIRERR